MFIVEFDHVVKHGNLIRISCREMLSLTRMNMGNHSIGDLLSEFCTELIGQKDPGSHHKGCEGLLCLIQTTDQITDHDQGLATASGHIHLAHTNQFHLGEATALVGAKLHGENSNGSTIPWQTQACQELFRTCRNEVQYQTLLYSSSYF